jgi:hypothetical protein
MVLPKFLSLIPFWRAGPALVLECYENKWSKICRIFGFLEKLRLNERVALW